MHPDEPGRSAGGAGGDAVALQDQHRDPAPREMEGEAGALHARPDHDDVGRLGHRPIMPPPGRARRPGRGPARSRSRGQGRRPRSWTIAVAAAMSGPGSRSPSRCRPRAHARAPRPRRAGHRPCREPQVERLRRDEQLDRQDPLDVAGDRPRVAGRDRAHRDVVLLVGARRDRVDRRRMREDLVLGHQGGRGVLVDHHPGVDPRRGRQERRQPAVEPRVDEQRGPPLADRAELGERDLGEVEREGDRLAVEVAAADHPPAAGRDRVDIGDAAAGEHERVVGRRVELDVEDATQMVERVAHRAVDLRHAAQRVRILDLVGVSVMAGLQPAVAEQVAQLGGHGDLARVRPGQLVRGGERHVRAEQRLDAHRRDDARGPHQPVRVGEHERADRAHHLRPVEEREALLGLEHERLEPGLAQRDRSPARPRRRPRPGRAR